MMEMPTTRRRNQKYLILDTESVWDPYLEEAYASIDKKNDHPRIGCRKLIAISLWAIEFDVLGRLSTEQLQTWLTTNGQTEADILSGAFQSMRRYPDHVLVGYPCGTFTYRFALAIVFLPPLLFHQLRKNVLHHLAEA